jgi:tetratricopeptide (TPR) repeat protein
VRITASWIALIAVFLGFFTWQRNKVWTSELSLWRDLVPKVPHYPWAWYNYCTTLAQAGRCEIAIPACREAIQLKSDDCSIHHNLGLCYEKTGQPELAGKELTRAVELAPKDFTKPYYSLADFYLAQKDFERAMQTYNQLLKQHPNNLKAKYSLAQVLLAAGRDNDYISEMREILELSPSWTAARTELAWFLARNGNCPDALKLLSDSPTEIPGARDIKNYCQSH